MKKILSVAALLLAGIALFAETDWRLEPLRITANSNSHATVFLICHMDLDKPITVQFDVYNAADSLLCQYTLTTPEGTEGNMEQKGYLIGPDTLMMTDQWLTLDYGEPLARLNPGDYVVAYGENPRGIGCGSFTAERHLTFNIKSGKVTVAGNVMSLLVGDDPARLDTATYIPSPVCFARLFNQNGDTYSDAIKQVSSGPTDASNLWLPATTLTHACYDRMFSSCTLLKTMPALPATKMDEFSCLQMFGGCHAAKVPPIMKADTLAYNCFRHMFQECNHLESAPDIPATEMEADAFDGMYLDCPKLSSIRIHFSDWASPTGQYGTYDWLTGVASTGIFYCPEGLAQEFGQHFIPEGWTVSTFDPSAEESSLESVNASSDVPATKIIRNGRILILRGDKTYDLVGNLVEE